MSLYNKKKIWLIITGIILGVLFLATIIYDQKGGLGKTDIFVIGITLILAIIISASLIRIGNKK